MNTNGKMSLGDSVRQQKVGGLAALYLAAAYVVAMPYFLVFVKDQGVVDPLEKVALLVGNHNSMQAMYLITYVIFGIVLAVLALTLHARLRDRSPILAQAATAVGLIWGFRARRERDDLQRRHGGGRRTPCHESGSGRIGLAGDRARDGRPRRIRR